MSFPLFLTVPAQQALASGASTITQSGTVTSSVSSTNANTIISTLAYDTAPVSISSFAYLNPLITSSNTVSGLIASVSGSVTGAPMLALSGQTPGQIWVNVTNVASTGTFTGSLNISTLIY